MNITSKQKLSGSYGIQIKRDGEYMNLWQENKVGYWLYALTGIVFKLPLLGGYTKQYWKSNLIVNTGLVELAALAIDSGTPTAFSFIGVGTDNTAAAAADTTLGVEITDSGLARTAGTKSITTTTVTNDTAQLFKSFSVTGIKAVVEVGIFNASSSGDMLSRSIITTKNVENGDDLVITYKISGANA